MPPTTNKRAAVPRRARYLTTGYLALAPRAFGQEFEIAIIDTGEGCEPPPFEMVGQVAVIRISGPLEQHPGWWWQDYETLHEQAEAAFASSARAVALCINSPGGAAAGCFELARALRAMSVEAKKPLGVFVDGMACSAAYALASAATPGLLYAPPTSTVASLAVYEMLVDQTGMDQQLGLRFTMVPSTGAELKLTGNPHVVPSEVQVAHTQEQVDTLTAMFDELVEEMRGIPVAEIRALRGATLLATQGADKGLVDALTDWNGFLAKLETSEDSPMPPTAQAQAKTKTEGNKSPFEMAIDCLSDAAKGDDEDAERAKKMLAGHYGGKAEGEGGEGGEEPSEDEKEKKAKAEAEEKAKAEAEEEAKKAKAKAEAEEEAKKAQARAAGSGATATAGDVDLARRVHELEVERTQEREATERKALLDQRPDFSSQVRASLEKAAISFVKDAVKNWPRVNASATAAAAAATPAATPGATDAAQRNVSAEQQALLDRMGKKGPQAARARIEGSTLVLEDMSPDAAAKRVKEMQEQGLVPAHQAADIATLRNRELASRPSR